MNRRNSWVSTLRRVSSETGLLPTSLTDRFPTRQVCRDLVRTATRHAAFIATGCDFYVAVFFFAPALPATFVAGDCFATDFFGESTALARAFVAVVFVAGVFVAGVFGAGVFGAGVAFTTAFFTTAFFTGGLAAETLLEPFQVNRAFFARATTLAMSSSEYTPLTPEIAASFMPCLMPSL